MASQQSVTSIGASAKATAPSNSIAPAADRNLKAVLTLARILSGLTLILVALGGYVRATGAGLACPDWPLCFGRVVPADFGSGVAQEVIHRFVASAVGVGLAALLFFAFRIRRSQPRLFSRALLMLVLLAVQIVFGGLTVLMKLNPLVVTAHLALGTVFFQLLALTSLERSTPRRMETGQQPAAFSGPIRSACSFAALLVFLQILIGGFVGSSGASMACPDAPLCFGRLLPSDASGPVLIQLGHRAVGVALAGLLFLLFLNLGRRRSVQMHTFGILFLVGIQISIGIANVIFQIPPLLTILHLVVAQLILFGTIVLALRVSNSAPLVISARPAAE